jgi:hypothetical protein
VDCRDVRGTFGADGDFEGVSVHGWTW